MYTFGKRKYIGSFENGKFNGQGKLTYSNGDTYEGEFKDNKKHGKGTLLLDSVGESYRGQFEDDMISGEGELSYPGGDRYQGQFQQNKKHGRGRYFRAVGVELEGQWVADKKEGEFVEKDDISGEERIGQYLNDEKDGEFLVTVGRQQTREQWRNGRRLYD